MNFSSFDACAFAEAHFSLPGEHPHKNDGDAQVGKSELKSAIKEINLCVA